MTTTQHDITMHEWKLRFAKYGYAYARRWLDFYVLENYTHTPDELRGLITVVIWEMHKQLAKDYRCYDWRQSHTFITLNPLDVGESLNCFDPLKPRLGITIEIRAPF